MPHIVFYVSSHGFGHAVRIAELVRVLSETAPALGLQVRTRAPRWIFPPNIDIVPRSLDTGVEQRDSLSVEPALTLAAYAEQLRTEPELVDTEAAELGRLGSRLVVADIPSAAFEIADRVGVPGVGIANFSWDWIYEPYVRATRGSSALIRHLRDQYGRASLLLRLPMYGDLAAFPKIEDVPLLARVSVANRTDTRRRLGLPLDRPVVLLSFGGFEFNGIDPAGLERLREYAFVSFGDDPSEAGPPNLFRFAHGRLPYVDVLAACDAVVAKPGYGIVADCLANRVPMLYVRRGRFREEPILERGLNELGRALRISRAELASADLGSALATLLAMNKPWADIRVDGAKVIAERLALLSDPRSALTF